MKQQPTIKVIDEWNTVEDLPLSSAIFMLVLDKTGLLNVTESISMR